MKDRVYRYWKYFRLGFGAYISLPLSIAGLPLTLKLYLVFVFPELDKIYGQLLIFLFLGIFAGGIITGWIHQMKTKIIAIESILDYKRNPISIRNMLLLLKNQITIMEAQHILVPEDVRKMVEMYEEWDRKLKWEPT